MIRFVKIVYSPMRIFKNIFHAKARKGIRMVINAKIAKFYECFAFISLRALRNMIVLKTLRALREKTESG